MQDVDLVYLMEVVDQDVGLYLIEVVLQGVDLVYLMEFFLWRLTCFVGLFLCNGDKKRTGSPIGRA